MLDINLFREEKGGNPEKIRESQRRRFANADLVDEVIELDKVWRQRQFELDGLRTDRNRLSKEIARLKIVSEDASGMIASTEENKDLTAKKEVQVQEALAAVQSKLTIIGNLVHDSVPVDNNEDNNAIIKSWGEKRTEPKLKNHVELVELLGIADLKKGANVAGGRGFYLKGDGVRLNQALINLALDFLEKRGFTALQTPFFMRKDIMAKCAQLAQFDEELYKVSGDGDDKYLIATAEQPLCAYHLDDWIHPSQLPLRYAGYSSCFRKEAGSHGRDTLGIFRVHQFEKVEQFCVTSPNGNDSWEMHEEMLKNAEDFYKLLNIPYQVVSIVSGALNDAAAKKYDLEGWFPASKTYRELVSCSNCTDYQSRRLEVRYGQKSNDKAKEYVHMLNSTLTATERTMCCILENNQKEDGVEIPEALRSFMGGKAFIPFKNNNSLSLGSSRSRLDLETCSTTLDISWKGSIAGRESSRIDTRSVNAKHDRRRRSVGPTLPCTCTSPQRWLLVEHRQAIVFLDVVLVAEQRNRPTDSSSPDENYLSPPPDLAPSKSPAAIGERLNWTPMNTPMLGPPLQATLRALLEKGGSGPSRELLLHEKGALMCVRDRVVNT
ncbi:Serine--tRNA ligase [Striga hermonthica]|uniref:serine--tRNA ligase n=1 Tax=Striga hermonthica TaxID=68872 RepID=A0A9N7NB88_STRHE|nr:Serine--tRNA ligase [Striga hermonthica]